MRGAMPAANAFDAAGVAAMRQSVSLTDSYQRKPMISGCFGSVLSRSVIHSALRPAASVAATSVTTTGRLVIAATDVSVLR